MFHLPEAVRVRGIGPVAELECGDNTYCVDAADGVTLIVKADTTPHPDGGVIEAASVMVSSASSSRALTPDDVRRVQALFWDADDRVYSMPRGRVTHLYLIRNVGQ